MESLPYDLTLKKKNEKKPAKIDEKTNNNIIEIKEKTVSLLIKENMDQFKYYTKSSYFSCNKNIEKFPDNYIFEKLFPDFTAFFNNLDYTFSEAIDSNTYSNVKKNMSKILRKYILDLSDKWEKEIINFIGYYWDALEKKVKSHTIILLYMTDVFINKVQLSDYDKNILYWAILFHDVGKFHEMNTIYKEDFSNNKFVDRAHPFKSAIIFIQTAINQKLIFFNDENEKKEFIEFFQNQFIKALYESFDEKIDKYGKLIYHINFNHIEEIKKFLLYLKLHQENKWIYEIVILIIFHQSLPNNNPNLHLKHVNNPILDDKYVKELFDIRLLELMRIILIYDSSSHCLFTTAKWEQEIDKYFNLLIKRIYPEKIENKIVYLAELDGDIDDVIAAEYLYNNYVLKCIVCDPKPSTNIGKIRETNLKELGVEIYYEIPEDTKIVFCGGALTTLSKYIENHKITILVMNGGFVGDNIVPQKDVLDKFKGLKTKETFNFNCDVESADKIMKSSVEKIEQIILVGKNVCHSKKNTIADIWNYKDYKYLFSNCKVKKEKCLHDVLMCHEGLCLLNLINEDAYCEYEEVYPYNEGLNGVMTKWGSKKEPTDTPYRKVLAATRFI